VATLLFLVLTLLAVYLACRRPPWFWAVFAGGPVLLAILGDFQHLDVYDIPIGPLQMRATDIGFIGVVAGVLYHGRSTGLRFLSKKAGGRILGVIALFLILKVIFSVVACGDQIAANRTASHAAGGLVAAVGDLRDGLLALIAPLYVYASRRSRELRTLGWPIVVATCLLLLKAAVGIGITGRIWTGVNDTDQRYIASYDAITLTFLGWMLLFLPIPRLKPVFARTLGCVALIVATVANHRSQWMAIAAGFMVLLPVLMLGRPVLRNPKLSRVALSGAAFALVATLATLFSLNDLSTRRSPLLEAITVRLYAVTNPQKDPTAKWRDEIWTDRIEQIGNNWPWGRTLGDRLDTLVQGQWLNLPDHNAYVAMFELGGAILCGLALLFWGRLLQIAGRRVLRETEPARLWAATAAIMVTVASLAYGAAYPFPDIGPALALILVLDGGTGERSWSRVGIEAPTAVAVPRLRAEWSAPVAGPVTYRR
jgi:hypothetical protein